MGSGELRADRLARDLMIGRDHPQPISGKAGVRVLTADGVDLPTDETPRRRDGAGRFWAPERIR